MTARISAPSTAVFGPYSSRATRKTAAMVATPRNATTTRPRRSGVPELNSGDMSVGRRSGWARKIGNWFTNSGLPDREAAWPA